MARAKASDAPPFDVELESSDKEWPPDGEPFRVVLVFNSSTGYPHYDAFLEASLIYKTRETKKDCCHHTKWPMIRAQKMGQGPKDQLYRIIVYLKPTAVPSAGGRTGGGIYAGTGSGTVYGSSSTPPPSGTVTQCATGIPGL